MLFLILCLCLLKDILNIRTAAEIQLSLWGDNISLVDSKVKKDGLDWKNVSFGV